MDVLETTSELKFRSFSISRALFTALLFCYLILAGGEQLYVIIGILKPKAGHLAGLLLLGWILLDRKPWIFPEPMTKAFLFILGSMLISTLCGTAPLRSIGYIGVYLFNFVIYFALPFQILQRIELASFLRIYWSSFIITGLYAATQATLSIFGIYDPFALQRVETLARGQAWTYEPSYYALYMVPYVMFHNGLALLREKNTSSFYHRIKLFGQNSLLMISTSTGVLITYFSFLISFGVGSCAKTLCLFRPLIRQKLQKAIIIICLSLTTLSLIFYETTLHTLFKFFYFGWNHISFLGRWSGIVASFEIFLKNPLIGVGIGGIGPHRFHEQSAYDLKLETLQEFEAFDPTNSLTEILASLGLVGLMAFIYLGLLFYRTYQQVMVESSIELSSKKIATALFFSLLIMIVALQMNQGLLRPYVWVHAAVVYGYLVRLQATKPS